MVIHRLAHKLYGCTYTCMYAYTNIYINVCIYVYHTQVCVSTCGKVVRSRPPMCLRMLLNQAWSCMRLNWPGKKDSRADFPFKWGVWQNFIWNPNVGERESARLCFFPGQLKRKQLTYTLNHGTHMNMGMLMTLKQTHILANYGTHKKKGPWPWPFRHTHTHTHTHVWPPGRSRRHSLCWICPRFLRTSSMHEASQEWIRCVSALYACDVCSA